MEIQLKAQKKKFFGVTIQDNLSWGAHVNKVAQACQNRIKISIVCDVRGGGRSEGFDEHL